MYNEISKLTKILNSELTIERIYAGKSWLMAKLSDGSCGICANYLENTPEDISFLESLHGKPALEVSELLLSEDPGKAAVGLSAINAYCNQIKNLSTDEIKDIDFYCTDDLFLSNKTVGIIGHMGRTIDHVVGLAKTVYVFEKNPKYDDLPDSEEEILLPQCDIVIISGTTIINHSLDHILECSEGAYHILLGPSVPLFRNFDNIQKSCGYALTNTEGFIQWNEAESGSPLSFCVPYMLYSDNIL